MVLDAAHENRKRVQGRFAACAEKVVLSWLAFTDVRGVPPSGCVWGWGGRGLESLYAGWLHLYIEEVAGMCVDCGLDKIT